MLRNVSNPILERIMFKLRDPTTDRKEFRETLEQAGEHLGVEIARFLTTEKRTVTTVMGESAEHEMVARDPLIISVLRAGIPLGYGLHRVFPYADVGFIGAMRNEDSETSEASISYTTTPEAVKGNDVILADTMLATGGSILKSVYVVERHQPRRIILACAVAARAGVDKILDYNPDIDIFAVAVDPVLDAKNYIVPGLGDAGDRCYGGKQEKSLS